MDHLKIGTAYFIRGQLYYTGRLVGFGAGYLILEEVAWIPETGRFADALRMGEFSEVEPYPDDWRVTIPIYGNITDLVEWPHPLPRTQK